MKRASTALAFVLAVLLVSVVLHGFLQSPGMAQEQPAPAVGRYNLAVAEHSGAVHQFFIDTQTGRVWRSIDGEWNELTTPARLLQR